MFAIVGQSRMGMPALTEFMRNQFFMCDDILNNSGVLTWAELNNCIAMDPNMSGEMVEMSQVLFQYFESMGEELGTQDYALSVEEMEAGVADMGTYIEDLDEEFRFFWDYFDFPDVQGAGDYTGAGNDGCVVIEEFEEGLRTLTDVNE